MQAHMFLNAESEYDRFQRIESGSEGADATYGAFSGEYKAYLISAARKLRPAHQTRSNQIASLTRSRS